MGSDLVIFFSKVRDALFYQEKIIPGIKEEPWGLSAYLVALAYFIFGIIGIIFSILPVIGIISFGRALIMFLLSLLFLLLGTIGFTASLLLLIVLLHFGIYLFQGNTSFITSAKIGCYATIVWLPYIALVRIIGSILGPDLVYTPILLYFVIALLFAGMIHTAYFTIKAVSTHHELSLTKAFLAVVIVPIGILITFMILTSVFIQILLI